MAALSGCPAEQPVSTPPVGTQPVVSVTPHGGPLPATSATADVRPSDVPGRPKIPPLDVPEGIGKQAKGAYERLASRVPTIHTELDGAAKLLATVCAIDEDQCQTHWRTIAKHLEQARNAYGRMGPRCSGSSAIAKQFEARLQAHDKVIRRRLTKLEEVIAKQLADDAQRKKFQEHKSAVAIPQPCLKYACKDW